MFETIKLLSLIALRNLFASRLKTLIVGGIIGFGSVLLVLGLSITGSIGEGMKGSIIGSLAGHLQVFDARSKDDLAIYGGMTGDVDLKPMEDFAKVKKVLTAVPNVKTVVPMGIAEAFAGSANEFDLALEKLRGAANRRLGGDASPQAAEEYEGLKKHVRRQVEIIRKDQEKSLEMVDAKAVDPEAAGDLAKALAEEFWAGFDADPLGRLEFLENKIAPQTVDGDMLWVRYVGTDLAAFEKGFERFHIVEGERIPDGRRGILLGKLYYEQYIKLKTALRLDQIKERRELGGATIAGDEELQRFVKENVTQLRDFFVQLDPAKEKQAVERLQRALKTDEKETEKLLVKLLSTDDANFDEHYRIFYEELAPLLTLYRVRVGDTITIKAFTKSGYMKSVNVKIWGVCDFKGLEKAGFAGMMSVMDLMSFRDLYGYLTADKAAEIQQLKREAGSREVARENAEAELFGSADSVVAEGSAGEFDEGAALHDASREPEAADRVHSQEEIESGVALNAAVVLEDPARAEETAARIAEAGKAAGLQLKVLDWQKAAGMIGQFITMLRVVLGVAVFVFFLIALVIINNSMVMATLQRVKEIGTLRAIGAQRLFVLGMVGVETVVIGLLFGGIGAGLGAGLVQLLHEVGIPASRSELFFLFSGPALHPALTFFNLALAFCVVLVVSVLSGFYPALLATRITPLEAMQSEE